MSTCVGVVSDTHGLVRPEVERALEGVDLIVHAGDVGAAEVLERLGGLAPVFAVRGNVDRDALGARLPATEVVEVEDALLYVLHDLGELDLDPRAASMQAVISGHSHRPGVDWRDGVLFLNPGSVGPRRFTLPVCLARLEVDGGRVSAALVELEL